MLKILSVVADFERKLIKRRMEEGFAKAKEEGKVEKPRAEIDIEALVKMYKSGASYRYLAEYFDVCQSTVRNSLKDEGVIGGEVIFPLDLTLGILYCVFNTFGLFPYHFRP